MKKLLFLIFIFFIALSCGYIEKRKENLVRPDFKYQETLYLNRSPADILPTYFVWNAQYSEFLDMEDLKEGTLYKAVKKADIEKNIYNISDIKAGLDYQLVENTDPSNDFIYKITINKTETGYIKQIDKNDILKYILCYDQKEYLLEGECRMTKTTGINDDIIQSFNFTIKDQDAVYAAVFKEFYIFKNEYEIIINKNQNKLNNTLFIILSVFIDQILKENGYEYK